MKLDPREFHRMRFEAALQYLNNTAEEAWELADADLAAHDARVRREAQIKVDDLAMLVRQLVHSIRKTNPDNETASRAVDYLKRHGLQGSPLRALGPAQETK